MMGKMSPSKEDAIKGSPERKRVPVSRRAVMKPHVLCIRDKKVHQKFSRKGRNGRRED